MHDHDMDADAFYESRESDTWERMNGNNNGGNEPCMEEVGKCP
jgi:hypothetical protein